MPAARPRCWPRRPPGATRCGRRCGPREWPGSLARRAGSRTSPAPRPPPSGCAPRPPGGGRARGRPTPAPPHLPGRQRALEDGKTVYMAVPRLAEPEPFFALDPAHLSEPPRQAASIKGASRSARRDTLAEVAPVDLVVMGCVAAGEDGARLGKGGGFAALEVAPPPPAGPVGPPPPHG